MKKLIIFIGTLLLAAIGILVSAFLPKSNGNVSQTKISFTSTSQHSKDDIEKSMNIVKDFFKAEFRGCTLTDLWYDEKTSSDSEEDWKKQYGGKEAIVLSSNFDVDASGGDGSLAPNETYTNWDWILVKNKDDDWKLETWGY